MAVGKQQRFKDNERFENVIQHTDYKSNVEKPQGEWSSKIFGNDHPIVLELACGKGEYSLALAQQFPNKNFIGIDIKGSRIWKGAKKAIKNDIQNVRFLRIYIDHITEYFTENEISDIWITFPDPYLKRRDKSKRLTSPKFLRLYQKILKPEGQIRLKTDSDRLYQYTKRITQLHNCPVDENISDVYERYSDHHLLSIKTSFERKHLQNGKTIKFIQFSLPAHPIEERW